MSLLRVDMDRLSRDPFLQDAWVRAIERLGDPGMRALLALAKSGNDADLDRAVKAFAAFRSEPAAAALPKLLANTRLSAERRADLVRSYANYQFDPPIKLDSLPDYLPAHGNEPSIAIAGLDVFAVTGISDAKANDWIMRNLIQAIRPFGSPQSRQLKPCNSPTPARCW